MDWITDQVAIGHYSEAQDKALLTQHGFGAVLSLDGTLAARDAEKLGLREVAAYRFIDGPGNDRRALLAAAQDLARLAQTHPPVLVHCHAGRSRSAVVVAAYLVLTEQREASAALAAVAAKREINVTAELVRLLEQM